MNHTVTLPDQTTFAANDGETVLAAAARQNLNLPHSCKSGVCGQCKAELVSGDIQMGGHSEQALSEAEKAQGKILMCCTTAQSDISINIPGYKADALPVRTLPARIENIIFKHDVALLKLALPKAPPFAFYAGQYIDLLLPGNVSRSYSIANPPDQEGILELHIRRRENGVCSEMIFGSEPKVKEKGIVRIKGPLGSFTLQEDSGRAVHFYWGARHQDDLYALEEAQGLACRLKNACFTPVLSRPGEGWQGRKGHVQDIAAQDHPDLSEYEVFACGSPAMTEQAKNLFVQQHKLPENLFFSDAFTPSAS
ncbi:TPA: 2Fe-2S iron-sulfur cluster-binding protein [Neisseria meningitidis]